MEHDLYPDPWSGSPQKFNHLFIGSLPTVIGTLYILHQQQQPFYDPLSGTTGCAGTLYILQVRWKLVELVKKQQKNENV